MRLTCPARSRRRSAIRPLGDERAVEPNKRHHVGDSAERHVVDEREQVGLGTGLGPEAAGAQHAVHRHHGHEGEPNGGEMPEAGEIVAPVRIDDGDRGRQHFVGLMVVDHDHVDAERLGLRQRLD